MKTGAILFIRLAISLALLSPYAQAAELSDSINEILSQSSQKNVRYGIHITEADSGKTLYAHNSDEPMTPASNMKLITTAAALHYLGADYTYETTIALKGNSLVIIGGGDPLLGDRVTDARYGRKPGWIFEDIAGVLIHHDVNSIEDIIIDTTFFDDKLVHPNWPVAELNRWYACQICGLNYNGNCIDITCHNENGRITVDIDPPTGFFKMINQIRPASSGRGAVGAYRTEKINTLILQGLCRTTQGPFRVAIERPAAFFAFLLAEQLSRRDIEVTGEMYEKGIADRMNLKILKTYTTPLTDCLARANKDSLGLAAEAMFKTIAANANGNKNGSWELGAKVISDYLKGLRIRPDKFYIDDGSGLSRLNKLSADCITTVLKAVYKSNNWAVYKDSLAAGGLDGTISRYFNEPKYKGRIIGKTGYINGVKSFSGYCITAEDTYIFSIITSGANGGTRDAINDIARAVIDAME